MAVSPHFSSEFVIRTKAVTETPDNYDVKFEVLGMFSQMKALAASGDVVAQYRLAQAYPKNSAPYLSWMQAAADQGFTNAMLALSLAHAESGTNAGLREAAHYITKIFTSGDSYIISEAKGLLDRNAALAQQVNPASTSVGKSPVAFFAHEPRPVEPEQADLQIIETPHL